jgi:hypothetical protein
MTKTTLARRALPLPVTAQAQADPSLALECLDQA